MPAAIKGTIIVDGQEIVITNPEKLLWPECGITKRIYLQKLAALSPYLLRYCKDRLLTVIRYPHGVSGMSFYQKNAPDPLPDFVQTANHENINYIVLQGLPELIWLGNLAALEFHPSLHYVGSELPCEWMIDLDPSREVEPRIMEATAIVGTVLKSLGMLRAYCCCLDSNEKMLFRQLRDNRFNGLSRHLFYKISFAAQTFFDVKQMEVCR